MATPSFGFDATADAVLASRDLRGVRALVTGASSGIGIETARALAARGAELILAVRDPDSARAAIDIVAASASGPPPRAERLDLSSLASVRALVGRLGDEPIGLLIANAGIMACPFGVTEDGFEMQMGTNHMGHFALVLGLTPNLRAAAPARVVMVSSAAHVWSGVDPDDLNFERSPYDKWIAYARSKTANALFALAYDRRLSDAGVGAWSVMPGRIATRLNRHVEDGDLKGVPAAPGARPGKTIEQGAATSVWAATAPELIGRGGLYLEDCAVAVRWEPDGPRVGVADHARDPVAAERLWDVSERLTGARLD